MLSKFMLPLAFVVGTFMLISVAAAGPTTGGIAVPGSASSEVATDQIAITLEMTTESDSFSEAKELADGIAKGLKAKVEDLHSGSTQKSSF